MRAEWRRFLDKDHVGARGDHVVRDPAAVIERIVAHDIHREHFELGRPTFRRHWLALAEVTKHDVTVDTDCQGRDDEKACHGIAMEKPGEGSDRGGKCRALDLEARKCREDPVSACIPARQRQYQEECAGADDRRQILHVSHALGLRCKPANMPGEGMQMPRPNLK
jgi:hypothetical protein